MSNILITGGYTAESVDEVMTIVNMSTGRLSMELSSYFIQNGHNVTLIGQKKMKNNSLFYRYFIESCNSELSRLISSDSDPYSIQYSNGKVFKFIEIVNTDDLLQAIKNESKNSYDLVIHSSAVGDYKPEFTFKLEDMAESIVSYINNNISKDNDEQKVFNVNEILSIMQKGDFRVNSNTKISSYEPNLTIKLGLTPKIISNLRNWFPKSKLVGFKLLNNVSKEEIIEVANKLCIKNKMDYIIANDLSQLRKANHLSHLVNKDGYMNKDFHSPYDIASFLENIIK